MSERCEETSSVLSVGETVTTKLQRIATKARSSPSFQFTSLFHLMDARLLRMCFERLLEAQFQLIEKENTAMSKIKKSCPYRKLCPR